MKTKLITIVSSVVLAAVSNGAIALSGTALKNVQGTSNTDLASGRLGLLIIDTVGGGFLNNYTATATASNALTTKTDFSLDGANLTVGSTFLGSYVAARLSTAVAFGDTTMSGAISGFDNSATYAGKNYAIVWFNTLTSAGTETVATASSFFGIARGADWTLPAGNTGTQSFGTGGSNLDQITLAAGGSGLASTAASLQTVAFASAGTTMQFVPEPSAALLGALGALGLLRRRRN
jgi:MYXO-CTERM domain-containing protein